MMSETFSQSERELLRGFLAHRSDVTLRVENDDDDLREVLEVLRESPGIEEDLEIASDAVYFLVLFQCTQDGRCPGVHKGSDMRELVDRSQSLAEPGPAGERVYHFADGSVAVRVESVDPNRYYAYGDFTAYQANHGMSSAQ